MTAPVMIRELDLRALAGIVSEDRPDLPDGEGLLADLMSQIRCDQAVFVGFDGSRQAYWFAQEDPFKAPFTNTPGWEDLDRTYWQHYWDSRFCSYPSALVTCAASSKPQIFTPSGSGIPPPCTPIMNGRRGSSTISWCACPKRRPRTAGPGRHVRLYLSRGPGPDFSERDRAVLTLLRPHLHQAYLDVDRRRNPVPRLTPRQWELMHLLAAGHTNTQIARRLGISEGTVRTHLENIYERLNVSSHTAAVTRAFQDRAASRADPS